MTSLYVYTPSIDGMISGDTHDSIIRLICSGEPVRAVFDKTNHDLVRARSRAVSRFLDTDFTHLLFVDSDVGFSHRCIAGMVATKSAIISTPYPKKRLMLSEYRQAIERDSPHPSAALHEWGFQRLPDGINADGDRAEVQAVPMGLTLIARHVLERMVEEYHSTLSFSDMPDMGDNGTSKECVALFQLILQKGEQGSWLMPEDFSFCKRWRDMGGKIHIYIGQDSPASHWGAYRFASEQ